MNGLGVTMRWISLAVLAAAAVALAGAPAEAAKKKRSAVGAQSAQVRGEAGVVVRRSRTRITVTRRSYLDAGTEVYPGSMSYRDYVFPPNARSALDFYFPTQSANESPLPHPWWLHSYQSPSWGY
jgi:hypothetical protein